MFIVYVLNAWGYWSRRTTCRTQRQANNDGANYLGLGMVAYRVRRVA